MKMYTATPALAYIYMYRSSYEARGKGGVPLLIAINYFFLPLLAPIRVRVHND